YGSCVEPAVIDQSMKRPPAPASRQGYGTYDNVVETLRRAISEHGAYLTGPDFTAADLYLGGSLRWLLAFEMWPNEPVFSDYVKRVTDRPAFERAEKMDAEMAADL
ncbi:MAG: glutathione S-transferase, partial [Pseudomonadota bacterium]